MKKLLRNQHHSRLFRAFLIIGIIGILTLLYQLHKEITVPVITPGGSYTEGLVGAPRFINPILAQTITDQDVTRLVFTPILQITNNSTEYLLAESFEKNSSGNKYTLVLKDNLYFSDGNKLDANDVFFTISQIQNPEINSPLYRQWQGVTVTKIDDLTLEFNLAAAYQDFIYNFEIGVLPEHLWSQTLGSDFIFENLNLDPIGNGPFAVSSLNSNTKNLSAEYTLTRNELAYEKAYLDHIHLKFYENVGALEEALNKGNVDAAYGISASEDQEYEVSKSVLPRSFGIFFNTKNQSPVFTQEIRRAISHAINRDALVSDILDNQAIGHNQYTRYQASSENIYNPTLARELISNEGFTLGADNIYQKDNRPLSFELSVPNVEELNQVAEFVKNSLTSIGVEVIIETFDQGNFVQEVLRPRDYDAILYGYELLRPSDLYAFWHSSQINEPGLNVSMFESKSLDTHLEDLRKDGSQEELLSEISESLVQAHPAIILYSPLGRYITAPHVKGISATVEQSQDRFADVASWYTKTRRMWPFFTDSTL